MRATAGAPPSPGLVCPWPRRPVPPCPALTCFWGLVQASEKHPLFPGQGAAGCRMSPQGVSGHRPASLYSLSDLAPALYSLDAADGRPSLWARLLACLPFLLGCLAGQGNQVTCYDLSHRGGAGEQVLP